MSKHGKLKIIPLGGLGEVGKNMTAYEFHNQILVVDAGIMFPHNDMIGIDYAQLRRPDPRIAARLAEKPPVPTYALWSRRDGVVAAASARGRPSACAACGCWAPPWGLPTRTTWCPTACWAG